MKIQVNEHDGILGILLTEVYSGIGLQTQDGEYFGICMRDTGFEFEYNGTWYEAKKGVIRKVGDNVGDKVDNDIYHNRRSCIRPGSLGTRLRRGRAPFRVRLRAPPLSA